MIEANYCEGGAFGKHILICLDELPAKTSDCTKFIKENSSKRERFIMQCFQICDFLGLALFILKITSSMKNEEGYTSFEFHT